MLGRVAPAKDDLPFERTDSRRYTVVTYKFDGQGWDDGKRNHIFVVDVASGEARQVTSGATNETGFRLICGRRAHSSQPETGLGP